MWLLLGMLLAAIPVAAGSALIYVANRGGTTIDVIDAATNKVVQTIGDIEAPEVIQFSADRSQLYIFSRAENFLIVMDRKSGKIVKKVPISGWANEAQTTRDGKRLLVCIRNTGTKAEDVGALDIIDTTTLEKVKSIPVRRGLHDLAITADGKYAAAEPCRLVRGLNSSHLRALGKIHHREAVQRAKVYEDPATRAVGVILNCYRI